MPISIDKSHPYEPDFVFDRESLAPNEGYVLAWIKLGDWVSEDHQSKKEQRIIFPPFQCVQKVSLKPGQDQFHALIYVAKRIRNYLSFCFLDQMPMYYRIYASHTLMTLAFNADFPYQRMALSKYTQETVDKEFPAVHKYVNHLLEKNEIDSFEDKIVNLMGSFLWTDDTLDRFMYAWRIVELISNKTVKDSTAEELNGIETIHANDKIRFTFRKKAPGVTLEYLAEASRIRNHIFHGVLSAETYSSSRPTLEWTVGAALELVKTVYPEVFVGLKV